MDSQFGGSTPHSHIPVASLPTSASTVRVTPQGNPQTPHLSLTERADLCEVAETVARIGDHVIFRGDLIGDAHLILNAVTAELSEEQRRKSRVQLEAERERLIKQLLKQVLERKLMFLEFMRDVPTDQKQEIQKNIDAKSGDAINEDLEKTRDKINKASQEDYAEIARQDSQLFRLAMVMKEQEFVSTIELDRYLRRQGSSMKKQQTAYIERKLGQQKMFQSIDFKPEITHDEMLTYYNEHRDELQVPTRVRWQQLSARFDGFETEQACGEAIAAMGNEVILGGAPLWAVAQRSSQGPNAAEGGNHDWTEWGDLTVSREILQAVFTLPIQKMSQIIEDAEGLHIAYVLERQEAHEVPFIEAQVDIEKTLQAKKRGKAINKYVAELRRKTPIWTIYDEEKTAADVH
ncbi:MAG: peptidylprolyl isomerase [Pirellulaceae bacterium]